MTCSEPRNFVTVMDAKGNQMMVSLDSNEVKLPRCKTCSLLDERLVELLGKKELSHKRYSLITFVIKSHQSLEAGQSAHSCAPKAT